MALSEKAMTEPLEEETAAEACFADELLFMDFTSDPYHPPLEAASSSAATAAAGELQLHALLFQELFDPSGDGLPGLPTEGGDGGDEEEEELEWLANKDAFPALETSFEIPAPSRSGGGSGGGGSGIKAGAAMCAVGERPSPVSVLAAAASFSAPVRPRSKTRRRGRRVPTCFPPKPAAMAGAKRVCTLERRRCRHCQAEETPQWRAGPEGPKTLCNACGVRFKSGRLVPEYRPASSPTFSAAIHSNSHRRIVEMRRQKAVCERRSTKAPRRPSLLLR
ncbi:unnamed protein product [Musa hybrid cultivar]